MAEPIRILHVIGRMDRGGAETFIMNLYRCIDRSRVQFDFVENHPSEAAYDSEIRSLGGRIFRCPHYNGRNHFRYTVWWKDFFRLHAREFAAVHGHLGSTAAIYLGIARNHGLYTIAHAHSVYRFSFRTVVYYLYSFPTRFLANHFFGCSDSAGTSRYGRSVTNNPETYTTLPCGIDTKKFAFDPLAREHLRSQLGIGNRFVVGHVGRFVSAKNHGFLLKVFSAVHHHDPDSVLLLVGDGALRPRIERKIRKLGLDSAVIFAGIQEDPSPWYQAMDVFVFPSLYEGFGMAALEAQTSGLPCILSSAVPHDCIATDLVTRLSVHNSVQKWTECILSRIASTRCSPSAQVAASGYDIQQTAQWVQDFYLKTGDKQT